MICNCGECVICTVIDDNGLNRHEMEENIKRREETEWRHRIENE